MSDNYKIVEIGDNSFQISFFLAIPGNKIFIRLMKLLGPAAGELVEAFTNKEMSQEESASKAVKAISILFENAEESEVEKLLIDLFSSTEVNKVPMTSPSIINKTFMGHIGQMYKLAYEVVRFNYADFLSDLGLDKVLEQARSQMKKQEALKVQKT